MAARKKSCGEPPEECVVAVLLLVVEYTGTIPDHNDLDEIVEKCREQGHVTKADFTIKKSATASLL